MSRPSRRGYTFRAVRPARYGHRLRRPYGRPWGAARAATRSRRLRRRGLDDDTPPESDAQAAATPGRYTPSRSRRVPSGSTDPGISPPPHKPGAGRAADEHRGRMRRSAPRPGQASRPTTGPCTMGSTSLGRACRAHLPAAHEVTQVDLADPTAAEPRVVLARSAPTPRRCRTVRQSAGRGHKGGDAVTIFRRDAGGRTATVLAEAPFVAREATPARRAGAPVQTPTPKSHGSRPTPSKRLRSWSARPRRSRPSWHQQTRADAYLAAVGQARAEYDGACQPGVEPRRDGRAQRHTPRASGDAPRRSDRPRRRSAARMGCRQAPRGRPRRAG